MHRTDKDIKPSLPPLGQFKLLVEADRDSQSEPAKLSYFKEGILQGIYLFLAKNNSSESQKVALHAWHTINGMSTTNALLASTLSALLSTAAFHVMTAKTSVKSRSHHLAVFARIFGASKSAPQNWLSNNQSLAAHVADILFSILYYNQAEGAKPNPELTKMIELLKPKIESYIQSHCNPASLQGSSAHTILAIR